MAPPMSGDAKILENEKDLRIWGLVSANLKNYSMNIRRSNCEIRGGIRGIIRDSNRDVFYFFSLSISKDEIYSLEIQAITGVAAAMTLRITKLWIEADSTFVVDSVDKSSHPPWKNLQDIKKAWRYPNNIDWRITHIWREANFAADYLSKRSYPCNGENIPIHSIPLPLLEILSKDQSGEIYQRL
ncbi:uncharacterized protein LOC143878125 [Tasmannia lanceolata]|uniref:uncharacterized protein LOC143878125 n=1 Tax=Tasmannia lanceolata TaxID=3420 RepID=UPI004063472D